MQEVFIITGLVSFGVLSAIRREWGIYLIVLLLPTYQIRFQVAGIPGTFLEGMILFLTALSLPQLIRTLSRIDKKTLALVALFLLAALISVFTSPNLLKAAGIFKAYFAETVLFFFLVLGSIDTKQKFLNLTKAISTLVLYVSVFGIYQFVTLTNLPFNWWGVEIASRRIVSVLNHPNAVALLLGPLLAMLVLMPQKTKLSWAAIILGLPTLYLSFSRAGWLALFLTISLAGLFTKYKKILLAGSGLLLILILLIPLSRDKLLGLASSKDPSRQNRIVLWSAAADILKHSPITGEGLAGFREAYKSYPLGPDRVVQNYPHNFFLNFWVETGFLGLVSISGLLFLFYKKIRSLLRNDQLRQYSLAAAAAMLMIILHSLVDVSYFKNDLAVLFWMIYALPEITKRWV